MEVAAASQGEAEIVYMSPPLEREGVLSGFTYKLKWPASDHAIYVTINDIERDGRRRPFEIFINTRNLEHYAWTVALTRMISAVFRRGGDVSFVAQELKAVFDPQGGQWLEGRYVPSLLAAIGEVIETHMVGIGFMPPRATVIASESRGSCVRAPLRLRVRRRYARGARRRPIRCRRAAEHALPAVSRNAADRSTGTNMRPSQDRPARGRRYRRLQLSGDRHPAPRSRSLGAAAGRNHELQRVRVHVRVQLEENIVSTAKQSAVRAGKHHFAVGDEQFTASVFREVGECLSGADCKGRDSITDRRWTLDEVLCLGLGQASASNRREREEENQMPHAANYARGAEQSVKARSMHRESSLLLYRRILIARV